MTFFLIFFFLNIRSTIKEVQSQGKVKCFNIKTDFELFFKYCTLSCFNFANCFLISTLFPLSSYLCQLMKFQKWIKFLVTQEILNFLRWLKLCPNNNFVRLKICPISYLVHNEENYNTFLSILSATNICRITVFLFQNLQKSAAFFRIGFGNHF